TSTDSDTPRTAMASAASAPARLAAATSRSATSARAVWSGSDGIGWQLVYAAVKIITSEDVGADRGFQAIWPRFPGAAQHGAERNDALQTRDRHRRGVRSDPGSAMHRCTLHRIRETSITAICPGQATSRQSCGPVPRVTRPLNQDP